MKRIAFIYNSVPDACRTGLFVECASPQTVTAIEQALIQGGNELIPVNLRCREQLERLFTETGKPDFAFCIAEGFLEEPYTLYNGSGAASVRQTLAELGVPSSHSPAAAMELCRHKERTYQVLKTNGVSHPWHLFLNGGGETLNLGPGSFPLFVKPAGGGNSVGIDAGSVVYNPAGLEQRIQELYRSLGAVELVAEKYLPGSEYTVAVLGNGEPVVLPPVAFPDNLVRSSAVKRQEAKGAVHIIDPKEPLYFMLRELALQAFAALGCADAIRVDVKSDLEGNLYIIDVNGTPSLAPSASLAKMAAAAGLEYWVFVNLLLHYGLQRAGLMGPTPDVVAEALEKLNTLRTQQPVVA